MEFQISAFFDRDVISSSFIERGREHWNTKTQIPKSFDFRDSSVDASFDWPQLSKSVSSAFLLKAMRGMREWYQEVSQSITTYYICTYTYTYTFLKYHLCIKKYIYIYSHPIFWKKTQLATRKSKSKVMKPWGENHNAVPQWTPADLRVPPKPGSCSKELRPPLRRFLSLGKREGWNIEPKNEDIMNRTYIYIYIYAFSLLSKSHNLHISPLLFQVNVCMI